MIYTLRLILNNMNLFENYNKPTPAKLGLAIKGICLAIVSGSVVIGATEQTISAYTSFLNQHSGLVISVGIFGMVADELGKMFTKE